MGWIDILWAVMGATSLCLGFLHALVWVRDRNQVAYLAFGVAAAAVAGMAIFELTLMRTLSVPAFEVGVRWAMVTLTVMLAALIVFVRLYFRAGSVRLAGLAIVAHALCLLPNFLTGVNLIYLSVQHLVPVRGWDGTVVIAPLGTPNPWMIGWYASNVVMIAFWVSVIRDVEERGERGEMRRRAWLTCGALIMFAIAGAIWAILVANGSLREPFTVNVPFVGVVVMISYALAGDVISSARLARDLARNQVRLLETEQTLLRQERDQAILREEMAHLSRVAMLSEMSSSLAHELNQPLTAVLSNAQAAIRFLAQDPPDLRSVRECLVEIVDSDRRASEVIRRLRSMLRKEPGRFQALDINEVLGEVAALARSDILNRNMDLQLELEPDLHEIEGDRVQLQQVVLNLIFNACDAMSSDRTGRTVLIQSRRASSTSIEVTVADTGVGFVQADLAEIFLPFVTSKPEGMGLGLSVCRAIVEAHQGRLWATRRQPRGACLHISLPTASIASALPQNDEIAGVQRDRVDSARY